MLRSRLLMAGGYTPRWYLGDSTGAFATSFDGAGGWVNRSQSVLTQLNAVDRGAGGVLMAGKDAGGARVAWTDGETLTAGARPFATGDSSGITSGLKWIERLGLWLAVGYTGAGTGMVPRISTSPDGENWTARTVPYTTWGGCGVAIRNGVIVDDGVNVLILGIDGSASTIVVWRSTDLVTWIKVSVNASYAVASAICMAVTAGIYLVAQSNQEPFWRRSTNLSSWTTPTTPSLNQYSSTDSPVEGGAGMFVAPFRVGTTNYLYSSPDGENWTQRQALAGAVLTLRHAAAAPGDKWLAVDANDSNRVYTSTGGTSWNNRGTLTLPGLVGGGLINFC